MNDSVNRPAHYTTSPATCDNCGTGIECIQVTRHMGFNLGNVIKYVWRAGLKGDALEDLRKARWYLDDEIESLEPADPDVDMIEITHLDDEMIQRVESVKDEQDWPDLGPDPYGDDETQRVESVKDDDDWDVHVGCPLCGVDHIGPGNWAVPEAYWQSAFHHQQDAAQQQAGGA